MSGAAAASAVAASSARDRRALAAWGEAAAGPLFLGDAAVTVRRPAWLEPAW
jgi:hypothetical protein